MCHCPPAVRYSSCFNSTLVRLKSQLQLPLPSLVPGFNSTLVRLKDQSNRELWRQPAQFQFHAGSIKVVSTLLKIAPSSCFNSTLVRLKGYHSPAPDRRTMFQFHAGAIKDDFYKGQWIAFRRFQFHAGSIKERQTTEEAAPSSGFNSTLVRLKDQVGSFTAVSSSSFNSTLVRLKDAQASGYGAKSYVSIPRWFD